MTAPANDNLANAATIPGTASSGSLGPVVIDDATREGGELGTVQQSVWYVFQAYATTTGVYLSTLGSNATDSNGDGFGNLDTRLAVWESTTPAASYGGLFGHQIAFNDDHDVDEWWSEVTFDVTAGLWYFIQVGTFDTGYTGTLTLNYANIPIAPPLTIDFISEASSCQLVSRDAGHAVPITMPTGIEAGDYLVCSMGNVFLNVVNPSIAPTGWTILQQDQWYKVADGTESGTTVNWTSQNTHVLDGDFRTWCAVVCCYRFSTGPTAIFASGSTSVSSLGASASASLGSTVDGLTTQLRVYIAVGQATETGPGSFLHNGNPLTGISWTNVIDRSGLLTIDEYGSGGVFPLDDSQAVSVGDSIFPNPDTGAVNPGDAVSFAGGPYSTGGYVHEVFFYWPQVLEILEAYWGILAVPL